jgi:tRNA A-37 threonylcarbamoyl transferase component Bud32
MNSPDADPVMDQLVPWMALYDENLAAGLDTIPTDSALEAPELAPRWQQLQKCLRLLRLAHSPRPAPGLDGYPGQPVGTFGRFHIRRELGRGGFGIVFLADDPRLRRPVALKVPRPDALVNRELRERFLREARATAQLDHPHLVPVYEAGEVGAVCYIASAYCPGTNMAAWLKEQSRPVPIRAAAALVRSVAGAVHHAHQHGILHRDLKPANILLVPRVGDEPAVDDLGFVPRLTDFGLAKLLEAESEQTASGIILGTPPYIAPEQAQGWLEGVGAATDVYALGVILYELLTRQLPCQGPSLLLTLEQVRSGQPVSPRQLRSEVPRDLETICLKCLEKEPRHRYASAQDLEEDLGRFLDGRPIQARPRNWLERFWTWCRQPERIQNAALLAQVIGLLICSVCLAGLTLMLTGVFPVTDPLEGTFVFVFQICIWLVMYWAGKRAQARRLEGLWLGFALPAFLVAYTVLTTLQVIPSGGVHAAPRPTSVETAQVITAIFLEGLVALSFAMALIAYYANRHLPGFLPRSSPKPRG